MKRCAVFLAVALSLALGWGREQAAANQNLPNGYAWGCLNISSALPFCNPSLTVEERLTDLVSRMTEEEKLGVLGADTKHTQVSGCTCMDGGVLRLGIPHYVNLVETNSDVDSSCLADNKCATEFPGPMNLAATFNRSLWQQKGEVISTEMRALNNLNWYRSGGGPYSLIGLSGFGPNINIARDPRFGRISEIPGEDPYLSGQYALHYVRGQQEGEDPRYVKMLAGLKHYACYSVEQKRSKRNFKVSMFDLWDTYLPQYKVGFVDANAQQVMCSYASINGVPACANSYLLNSVMRQKWNRPNAVVASDCGAIDNMVTANRYARNKETAAAKSLNAGTDIDLGGKLYYSPKSNGGNAALEKAIHSKLTNMSVVDEAVKRVMRRRFVTGQFDPLEGQVYADARRYGYDQVNATQSWNLVLNAAAQSLVLLKNDKVLPITPGHRIAVLGPHIFSQQYLMEDYSGKPCNSDKDAYGCMATVADMMQAYNAGGETLIQKGVDMNSYNFLGMFAALKAARKASYVFLFLGDSRQEEHEGHDRKHIALPGL